jgi:hypothetical protein
MPKKNPAALALQKLSLEKTTPEERKEFAREAGKASGAARKRKRQEAHAGNQ